jgi:CRP/FNR family transcriptional regulator, cyclic AMP receptor protein
MRSPYGLELIENCLTCPQRRDQLFCDLSPEALKDLAGITSASAYPRGAFLFVEQQDPRGIFIICSGRVKLSSSSSAGKTMISRFAETGEILGVASVISGKHYVLTAEVVEPTQANFVSNSHFLEFLRKHGEAALRAAQQLAENYDAALSELRNIGMSHSAEEKLARFLLEWSTRQSVRHPSSKNLNHFKLSLTHEEIAGAIGTSRETVTRVMSEFKRRGLLQMRGSTVAILNRSAFMQLAGS